jgi:phosphoribosyl-dephospho-CoA transferase
MAPRIHDLLEIDADGFLQAQARTHSSVPAWVAESLTQAPFVVVRRGPVSEQEIPVGVRGAHRNERWAGGCHPSLVKKVLAPQTLLARVAAASVGPAAPSVPAALAPAPYAAAPARPAPRAVTIPALRTLSLLTQRWKTLDSRWGPGGSVGFELATGRHVVTPQSDLDVVIYAQTQMAVNEARTLRDSTQGLPAPVDIRVETPTCGFSLAEYASRAPAPILIRTASGAFLGANPWETHDSTDATGTAGAAGATGAPQPVAMQPATAPSAVRHR